ncbi:Tryptophan synthase alpha chain [Labilithrix luteola]|uniref:Tryptophan synthase alpha chain n=1 Tax=Labilithrix luteola TaxID=1391654 RepID=A0A0K1Q162_9BACT|nr:hypothetical protein [Labilithrix luteola]AKU99139.1 Tryptophan synthase alpha chain [Labilithrix luteola]
MHLKNAFSALVLAAAGIVACSSGTPSASGASGGSLPAGGEDETARDGGASDPSSPQEGAGKCANDCGPNQVCSDGACVDLPKTCPCPVESYCDLATNSCKVGCTKHEECSKGRFCDVAARICKDGCRSADDCAKPENGVAACNEGTCSVTCDAKFHACGDACKSDRDTTACGASCTVCPTPANATVSCYKDACEIDCNTGSHKCGAACALDTAPETCGSSCTPCPTVTHGKPTCDGTKCGIQCDAGFALNGATCVEDCATTGCGNFEWCDPVSRLCKAGCEHHSECASTKFCKLSTHTCEDTTSNNGGCGVGFRSIGTCSDGRQMCVNASLPTGTTFKFSTACPAGSTARGSTYCSGPTYVCVPDN